MKNILIYLFITFTLISCASPEKKMESPEQRKAKIYFTQGTRELMAKDYTAALNHLLQANTLDQNNSEILNNLGMTYFFKKKPDIAVRMILQAIKADPKNTEARLNLGTVYINLGNYDLAKQQYNIVLETLTYGRQYKTYFNLGIIAIKQGRENDAIDYFQKAITENENYCPAFLKLGDIHFKKHEYEKSLNFYKRAGSGVCYDNPDPLYRQALSLLKLKEYGSAKLKLEEVIERFSLTKFERMAHKQLKAIDNKIYSSEQETNAKKGNILTPNF